MKKIIFLTLLFLTKSVFAQNQSEFHFSNEFLVYYNDISGPGKAASSLTEKTSYADILSINSSKAGEKLSYNYSLAAKFTDDNRNDLKKASLTNLNANFTAKSHRLSLGDIFESFSRYSLATAVKGASYKFKSPDFYLPQITLVFGDQTSRWDSFWKDPATRTQKKQAIGANARQNLSRNLSFGLSGVNSKDINLYNSAQKYDISNLSLDLNYKPISAVNISGEWAASKSKDLILKTDKSDNAFRIETIADADPSRVELEYEKIDPNFISPLGSSSPDREKVKTKWRYKKSKFITFTSGILYYRNNLNGQLTATTRNWRPEFSVSIKRPFASRQYSYADFSYKFDRKYSLASSQSDHYFNLNYRDQIAGFDSDSNLAYSLYKTKTAVRDSSEINFNTSLSQTFAKNQTVLTPRLNLGAWHSKDELSDYSDKLYEYSISLDFEEPKLGLFSQLKIGQNILKKEDPSLDDSAKTFAGADIRKKISLFKTETSVYFKAGYNDFDYSSTANNFREKSVSFGFNTSF